MEIQEMIKDYIECGICYNKIKCQNICPKCNKSICSECFKKLTKSNNKEIQITCPFCKAICKSSSWIKTKNLNRLIKVLDDCSSKFCTIHKKDIAIHFCYDCNKSICGTCVITNQHKSHRIMSLEKYKEIDTKIKQLDNLDNKSKEIIEQLKENKENLKKKYNSIQLFFQNQLDIIKEYFYNLSIKCDEKINFINSNFDGYNKLKEFLKNLKCLEYNNCDNIPKVDIIDFDSAIKLNNKISSYFPSDSNKIKLDQDSKDSTLIFKIMDDAISFKKEKNIKKEKENNIDDKKRKNLFTIENTNSINNNNERRKSVDFIINKKINKLEDNNSENINNEILNFVNYKCIVF